MTDERYHSRVRRLWNFVAAAVVLWACGDGKGDGAKSEPEPAADRAPSPGADEKDAPANAPEPAAEAAATPEPKLIEPMGAPAKDTATVRVELPPPPTYPEATAPDRYPDGAWSIAGIREDLDRHVADGDAGKEITVKGWVSEIYVPPACPAGDTCPPAKQPHLWITDDAADKGKRRAMMVVNYRFTIPEWDKARWKRAPEVGLEVGKQYTIKGKVRTFSDTGFASAEGLLEFVAYHPLDPATGAELADWVYPPGAYWHPDEVARQDEETRALAERVAK
jgi:hypothetical protein